MEYWCALTISPKSRKKNVCGPESIREREKERDLYTYIIYILAGEGEPEKALLIRK